MTRAAPPEPASAAPSGARLVDELQAEFARAISDEAPAPDAPRSAEFAALAGTGGPRLSASEQLEIYREQFWLRHHGALAEDYPALLAFLGAEWFGRAVQLHVQGRGLTERNLTWFGRDFARAVALLLPEVDAAQVSVAVELARLEWLLVESFHAASAAPLEPDALAAFGPRDFERLGFAFAPSMRLARFGYPVTELRARLLDAETSGGAPPLRSIHACKERPTYVVVYRPRWRVVAYEAGALEFAVLEALAAGKSLVEAVLAVSHVARDDSITSELRAWFEAWGSRGLVTAVRIRT